MVVCSGSGEGKTEVLDPQRRPESLLHPVLERRKFQPLNSGAEKITYKGQLHWHWDAGSTIELAMMSLPHSKSETSLHK